MEAKEAEVSERDPKKDPRRMLTGLCVHRDLAWDYSFWRPIEWRVFDMESQYGFIYSPGDDPRTGFYVAVQDLSETLEGPVTEEDLPALHEGILEGVMGLEDCEILYEKEVAKGFALGFEFMLTFTLDGETKVLRAGDGVCIPPNVAHKAVILDEATEAIDAWSPPRDDYKS